MADLIAFPYDSLLTNGDSGLELDRAIDASMYRRLMSKYFTTGVFPDDTNSAFKVLAFDKNIIVKKGSANINGVYAELEEDVTINITDYISSSNTVTLAVALRNDDTLSARKTTVQIVTNRTNQLVPPTRNSTVYEIYVAKVVLEPNTITVYQSDITDLRLNTEYCGVVTATVKGVDTTTFYDQFQGALDKFLDTVDQALDGTLAGNLQNQINERIKITDIVDNLESTDTDKPLSANQGNVLANKIKGGRTSLLYVNGNELQATIDLEGEIESVTANVIPVSQTPYNQGTLYIETTNEDKRVVLRFIGNGLVPGHTLSCYWMAKLK